MTTPPLDLSDDNFWDAFGSATAEEQARYFLKLLDEGEMDGDLAFDMLETLRAHLSTDAAGHALYAELVRQLREKAPEAYRGESRYFHQTLLTFAIEDGRREDIPALLEPFRRETDLDIYSRVVDALSYHGLERELVPVMSEALSAIKADPNLADWGVNEFAEDIMRLMLWIYLDTAASPSPDDADFLAATEPYGQWAEGWLEKFVPRFAAASPSAWKPDDFALSLKREPYRENLLAMLAEFVADCHRDGIPYERGYAAMHQIAHALEEQTKEARENSLYRPSARRVSARRLKKSRKWTKPLPSPLLPAYETLNKTLADLMPMIIGGRPYHLAATLELLPRYFRFLLRLGLVSEDEVRGVRQKLRSFPKTVADGLAYYGVDRRCVENMFAAWEE